MADNKASKIEEHDQGVAVTSTTKETPHPADESSAPGPYDGLDANRPPVSTDRPDVPIAQSLVAGAGAPQPAEFDVSTYVAPNAYVTAADRDNLAPVEGEKKA